MYEMTRVELVGTDNEKCPFTSVTTPKDEFPLATTFTQLEVRLFVYYYTFYFFGWLLDLGIYGVTLWEINAITQSQHKQIQYSSFIYIAM